MKIKMKEEAKIERLKNERGGLTRESRKEDGWMVDNNGDDGGSVGKRGEVDG